MAIINLKNRIGKLEKQAGAFKGVIRNPYDSLTLEQLEKMQTVRAAKGIIKIPHLDDYLQQLEKIRTIKGEIFQ